MKKMLMCATVASMIGQFNMSNINILQEIGYDVHVACDFTDTSVWTNDRIDAFKEQLADMNVKTFQIYFSRSPFKLRKNLIAYNQIKKILKENSYEFVHCHTPVASVICRIAAHQNNIRCIYTAHGFHFYKGAPLKNWLIFYPVEKFLSGWTDVLITINREDYDRANKKFRAKQIEYIPGVGIDTNRLDEIHTNRQMLRKEFEIKDSDIVCISVGELSKRKNHEVVIRALSKIKNANIKYYICGIGELESYLNNLIIKLKVSEQIKLLGYRKDVFDLYRMADIFVFPSIQEGLPVALMEAIACHLPVLCSNIRGNRELVKAESCMFLPNDVDSVKNCIEENLRLSDGNWKNIEKINADFQEVEQDNYNRIFELDVNNINKEMKRIYLNLERKKVR